MHFWLAVLFLMALTTISTAIATPQQIPFAANQHTSEMELDNFVIVCGGPQKLHRMLSPKPTITNVDPMLFSIQIYHKSDVKRAKSVWSTVEAGTPFIRASVGDDSLTPGNGEYRIIQHNKCTTTHQSIQNVELIPKGQVYVGKPAADVQRVVVSGELLYSKSADVDEPPKRGRRSARDSSQQEPPTPVLKYHLWFYETSIEELRLEIQIEEIVSGLSSSQGVYDRIILQYAIGDEEDVFGLGETFSYWSLKGQRVPIISREQGIGRGKQPLTYIQNHIPPGSPAYSGGDALSTYTAIAHYITSQSRSIYLHNSELSFFDFTKASKILLEVTSRTMRMSLFYAQRPLDLVRSYTKSISGRQKPLPGWISGDNGAVIGLQGGEAKVMNIVKNLTENGVPVAAVWLQDWVGTRQQPLNLSLPIPFLIPGFPGRTTATIGIKGTSPQKRLWWNWEFDRQLYPNWPQFVKSLREKFNVRVMTYINPFLSDVDEGGKPRGSWNRNYFKEASLQGFLVKRWVKFNRSHSAYSINKSEELANVGLGGREMLERQHVIEDEDGQWSLVDYLVSSGPGVSAGMIDLSNKAAFEWYKSIIKENMISHGVSGWMADFAEYLPFDGVLHSQLNVTKPPNEFGGTYNEAADTLAPHAYHNIYPREWARLNKEAVQEIQSDTAREIVFFMRSAYSDSPKYCNAFWNGDQLHTWDLLDGLESTIYGSMSAGLSGVAFSHSDIGGYTTLNVDPKVSILVGNRTSFVKLPIIERRLRYVRQDLELFYRWMEIAVFTSYSMYRTHEGSVPEENLQVWSTPETIKTFKHFSLWFNQLKNYRDLLIAEHQVNGYPLMRPLYLHYPHGNKPAQQMERLQFLFGPLLLVVPISSPGIETLNQKIQEPPADEETDAPIDPENEELIATVSVPVSGDVTSDEEDLNNLEDLKFGDNRAVTAKGRMISNVRSWAAEGALTTLRILFRAFPMKPDVEGSPQRQLTVDVDSSHLLSKSAPKSFSSPIAEAAAGPPSPDKDLRSYSPMKQFGQLSLNRVKPAPEARRNPTRKHPIVAPSQVPKPKHGRPFLPAGKWTHVWTEHTFDIRDYNGVYITENSNVSLPCPIGKPGIFVREIDVEEMRDIITRGKNVNLRSRGGEDWLYWLDVLDQDDAVSLLSSLTEDELVIRAMKKYEQLRNGLDVFLKYAKASEL